LWYDAAQNQLKAKINTGWDVIGEEPNSPQSTGTITSLVPENGNILKWSNNGYLRRITNQGGVIMSADSSLVLHAGDRHDQEDADLGIDPTTTTEKLWLTADGEVKVITNWQDGIANAKTWTFKADGRLIAPDGTEVGSGGFVDPPIITTTDITTCFDAPSAGWYFTYGFIPDDNEYISWQSADYVGYSEPTYGGGSYGLHWLAGGCSFPRLSVRNGTRGRLTWAKVNK
jgi:hypothetical protein